MIETIEDIAATVSSYDNHENGLTQPYLPQAWAESNGRDNPFCQERQRRLDYAAARSKLSRIRWVVAILVSILLSGALLFHLGWVFDLVVAAAAIVGMFICSSRREAVRAVASDRHWQEYQKDLFKLIVSFDVADWSRFRDARVLKDWIGSRLRAVAEERGSSAKMREMHSSALPFSFVRRNLFWYRPNQTAMHE